MGGCGVGKYQGQIRFSRGMGRGGRSVTERLSTLSLVVCALAWVPVQSAFAQVDGERIPPKVREQVAQGEAPRVLVAIAEDLALLPAGHRQEAGGKKALRKAIKEQLLGEILDADLERVRSYDNLPMLAVRVRTTAALERLAARSEVLEIYEDIRLYPILAESLPLVGQTGAAVAGQLGSGTSVAVLDTGVDYTKSVFGSCTAPGLPAACRVAAAVDTATDDGARDANGHGTMVAGIAASVAPATKIVALDVFDGSTASSVDIVEAIDWVIANRMTYNIVAINMSLGGATKYTALCSAGNPFRIPIRDALNAGIPSFVASGNEAYTDGLSIPACSPDAVSVGAVYDANVGSRAWSACTDSSTAADKVACFSNSASFLSLLAPGAIITVAGSSGGGTSFASPHAAGAYAVLRGARPVETTTAALARLSTFGTLVTDGRNGIQTRRIQLSNALQLPPNDAFASATAISGTSGATTGNSELATLESGEALHAGVSAASSIWWKWTAPSGGDVTVTTTGSAFDTVLAAYTGSAVSALTGIAANDNQSTSATTSAITFRAVGGVTYYLAIAGKAGASGSVALNWNLVEPVADLAVSIVATPDPVVAGNEVTYTLTVVNNGPFVAESVLLSISVPANATINSASSGCTVAVGAVACELGNIAVGQTLTRQIVILPASPGPLTVGASVDGAWGDGVGANDTASASPVVAAATGESADVPLPAWAMALLGAALLGAIGRRR